ncbi:hypothetical protein A6V36_30465 [Paraburkholderia ginsengiterrae]|nr:hypothetical protein A6V36_30465 [Paraburkholderia ginsengiterrae]
MEQDQKRCGRRPVGPSHRSDAAIEKARIVHEMTETFVLKTGGEQLAIRVVQFRHSQFPVLGDVTLLIKDAMNARPERLMRSIVADGAGELCISK